MINPAEPKIWFKGSEFLIPCFLEEITIDYSDKKVFGLIRSKGGTPFRMWFGWDSPNIIMRLSDQEEQYG